jgi:hypothetical protein
MTAETLAPSQFDFAALCASRAQMITDGSLLAGEYGDEMQVIAREIGLIAEIGQDAVQNIMAEAIAAASLVPNLAEPDFADEIEAEIMLRAADLVRQWELDDPRDRWGHTGEHPPAAQPEQSPRRERYTPPQSTVDAFRYVLSLNDPDYLARWLANHPADAPALYKIWKASRC